MKRSIRLSVLAFLAALFGYWAVAFGELQVHLKLDGDLVDSAGGDNNGTLIDGARGNHHYVSGKLGGALELQNGDYTVDGDGVSIAYAPADSGTVALWYKPNRIYNYNTVFDNSIDPDDWECWIYQDARLRARVESDTSVTADLISLSSSGDPRNEWFHVAFMWNRTGVGTVDTALYVNGVLRDTSSGTWVRPGGTFFLAGGNTGNDFGDGTWDDLRIYDHVLSEAEVRSLAMRGLIVEPSLMQLTEGQTASYAVVLDYPQQHEPRADVFVSITGDENLSIDGLAPGEAETLVFRRRAFQVPQAVLAALPDMRPFIERKTGPAAMYVDLIHRLRIEHEAVVIAFDWDFLREVETLSPAVRTGALGSGPLTLTEIQAIQSRGIDFIDWAHGAVTAETIDLVHAYGMELHVWTVNDAGRMQALIGSGVDGITTDNPQLARELLGAQ